MLSSIWTQCAGDSRRVALALEVWRSVEAQHQVSTRKLVDTVEEQALLEGLLERVKPPDPTRGSRHYLLSTPFRYPPLKRGSRFGTRQERSIWYGSESVGTVFAEVAYYRLLFLEGTSADLGVVETALTVFAVKVGTVHGMDLAGPPFDRHAEALTSKTSYAETQPLGAAMRAAGVDAFRALSARDAGGGVNVGVFDPVAFGRSRPDRVQTWHCSASRDRVEMLKRDYFERATHSYPRSRFLIHGALPGA